MNPDTQTTTEGPAVPEISVHMSSVEAIGTALNHAAAEMHELTSVLADSGDHGNRQGAKVQQSVDRFQSDLVTALHQGITEIEEFARVTFALAAITRDADASMTTRTRSRQENSESVLHAHPFPEG